MIWKLRIKPIFKLLFTTSVHRLRAEWVGSGLSKRLLSARVRVRALRHAIHFREEDRNRWNGFDFWNTSKNYFKKHQNFYISRNVFHEWSAVYVFLRDFHAFYYFECNLRAFKTYTHNLNVVFPTSLPKSTGLPIRRICFLTL